MGDFAVGPCPVLYGNFSVSEYRCTIEGTDTDCNQQLAVPSSWIATNSRCNQMQSFCGITLMATLDQQRIPKGMSVDRHPQIMSPTSIRNAWRSQVGGAKLAEPRTEQLIRGIPTASYGRGSSNMGNSNMSWWPLGLMPRKSSRLPLLEMLGATATALAVLGATPGRYAAHF